MTSLQVVALGVRLFAAWLVVRGVAMLVAVATFADGSAAPGWAGGLLLLGALLLWLFPLTVARRILPNTQVGASLAGAQPFMHTAFVVTGLLLLASALPALLSFVVVQAVYSAQTGTGMNLDGRFAAALIENAGQGALGLLVMFNAARLVARFAPPAG